MNIADAPQGGRSATDRGTRKELTRAYQVRADRNGDGTAKLTVDIVSIDGPHELLLDLAGAVLGRAPAIACLGRSFRHTPRRVSTGRTARFEIPLGQLRDGEAPEFVAIGITPGNVTVLPWAPSGRVLNSNTAFDVATLLAAPDEESRRTGLHRLTSLRTDRVILSEFISRLVRRARRRQGIESTPETAPAAGRILRPDRAAAGCGRRSASAARYLAYSEAKGAAEALRPLLLDSDPLVREAAVIGLTFLGQADYLEELRSIVNRTIRDNEDEPRPELVGFHELDPLIALAHQHSDAAVDIVGARLISDLKGLQLVQVGTPQVRLQGRGDRAAQICSLLGRTGNPRSGPLAHRGR